MQLDQLGANIRYRIPWEGMDLGFAMARRWYWRLWLLWIFSALPLFLLLSVIIDDPGMLLLVSWWLKPLYEPFLLVWLSRWLFGEQLTLRQTLGHWRFALRALFANLTWRRLSPNRSFFMPVTHLEGLTRKARSERCMVLNRGASSGKGGWLTIAGIHFETFWQVSMVFLLFYLVPAEMQPDDFWAQLFWDQSAFGWFAWLNTVTMFIAMSVMAPFYVAGGFGLYLARRTELEGWDIELMFRRMAPRFMKRTRHNSTAPASVALMLFAATLLLPLPQQARAEGLAPIEKLSDAVTATESPVIDASASAAELAASQQLIGEVLAGEEFGRPETRMEWEYVGEPRSNTTRFEGPSASTIDGLASLFEVLMWLGGIALVVFLLYQFLKVTGNLPAWPGGHSATARKPTPSVLFGMPVTPASLPDDIPGTVRRLLEEGATRAALGILYRATLVSLIHHHHLQIPDSATEGECRQLVSLERPKAEADFFTRLTTSWIRLAYGHREPQAQQVLHLCEEWQQLLQPRTASEPSTHG